MNDYINKFFVKYSTVTMESENSIEYLNDKNNICKILNIIENNKNIVPGKILTNKLYTKYVADLHSIIKNNNIVNNLSKTFVCGDALLKGIAEYFDINNIVMWNENPENIGVVIPNSNVIYLYNVKNDKYEEYSKTFDRLNNTKIVQIILNSLNNNDFRMELLNKHRQKLPINYPKVKVDRNELR